MNGDITNILIGSWLSFHLKKAGLKRRKGKGSWSIGDAPNGAIKRRSRREDREQTAQPIELSAGAAINPKDEARDLKECERRVRGEGRGRGQLSIGPMIERFALWAGREEGDARGNTRRTSEKREGRKMQGSIDWHVDCSLQDRAATKRRLSRSPLYL
jgi:hypothetical protein